MEVDALTWPLAFAAQQLSIKPRTARYYAANYGCLAPSAPVDCRIPVLEICGKRSVLREDVDRYITWKRNQTNELPQPAVAGAQKSAA